jgi:putative transposase
LPHHVTQRGSRRGEVFFSDEDREAYLAFVADAAERFGVRILAWCLMPNHVHFVAIPDEEQSLARCFGRAHTAYSRMVNFREGWRGHLWQGRFASSPMDEQHLYRAVRYVERNPARARLAPVPWGYPWSSARFHVGEADSDVLVASRDGLSGMIDEWREYLLEPESEWLVGKMRSETSVGRPIGDEGFVAGLEERVGRSLVRRPPGRPRRRRRMRGGHNR